MENVDLPPPYCAVIDVSTPPSDVLIMPQEIVKKQTIAEEPLVGHIFDNQIARLAFIQKILLLLLMQALVSFVIMELFTFNCYENQSICAFVSLGVYLFMMGILLISDKARTTNPYKSMLFVAYPIIFGLFISFSTLGHSIREMSIAFSGYFLALFALLAYSVIIYQTSSEYSPRCGILIATIILLPLFLLTTQICILEKRFIAYYTIAMLVECIYIVWDIHLMTSLNYRYAMSPSVSDVMIGVLLIRIDFIYYTLTYIKKCLPVIFSFKD